MKLQIIELHCYRLTHPSDLPGRIFFESVHNERHIVRMLVVPEIILSIIRPDFIFQSQMLGQIFDNHLNL